MAFTFGSTPATKPSGFSFGATSTAPSFGTGFGATTSAAPSTGFGAGFGATATTSAAAAPGFGFGAATTSAAPSFGFGATTTSAAPSFGFGAATTSAAPSFGFGGTPAASGTPAFGAATSNTGFKTGTGFGFGASTASSLGATTTTTSSTFSFGGTSSKPFCATTSATTKPGSSFGLGGANLPQTTFGAAATTKPQTNLGLGGTTNSTSGGANESNKNDLKALKETQIPNEILSTVDEFKKLVKEERNISSDIAHISSRIHDKIKVETEALVRLVSILSSGIKKNKAALDKLKLEAAQELRNAEIAQRTKDTPGALQYENVAPYEYFSRLVSNFENDMLKYRQQIDETEQHLQASAASAALSPEDLSKAIRKIHEAFTSLAGRYQHIHDCVQEQKGLYVKLHRQIYGVSTDLFDTSKPKILKTRGSVATMEGPSPFILGHRDPFTAIRANLTAQPQQSSINSGGAAPTGPPTMGLGATSSFGISNNATPQFGQQGSMFSGFSSTTPRFWNPGSTTVSSPFTKVDGAKDNKICFC